MAAAGGVSASTGKLVLAGLAAVGLGAAVYRGVSRQVARDERRKRLTTKAAALTKTKYPVTPKEPEVTDFHGTKVTDNYRWLEDPDSDVTKAWVQAQKQVTDDYLDTLKSQRAAIAARLKETFNYERYGVPFKRGTRVFYYKNDGLQNQSVLYWYDERDQPAAATADAGASAAADSKGPAREPARVKVKVLLDPNTLEKDGTASLGSTALTDSGELFAYGVARSGSDWNTIHVRRVSDGHDFADKLEWVKFSSIAWTTDEKGFFYSRYPQPKQFAAGDTNFARGTETDANLNQAVYYHRLGTEQKADKLIWANPTEPKWMTSAAVTDDGDYVLLYINDSCDPVNRLFYAKTADLKLTDPTYDARGAVVKLVDDFKAEYSAVHNTGSVFYFKTNLNASNNKLIAVDLTKPDPSHWQEIIAQTADVMDSIQVVDGDKFVAVYMQHALEVPRVFDLKGQPLDRLQFGLPAPGSVVVAGSVTSADVFYKFTSVLFPGTIYRLNVRTGVVTIWGQIEVKGFDPTLFDTKQIFYNSKDGTRVPMLITHRKSVQRDGNNPTILYGYGGFNISLPPAFSISVLLWLNHFNGVYAVPNIRGGGEYGEEWHKAGSLQKKQNCFDDFIAAAQWLIDQKFTRSARLAINGASNGGLLVAACANQRPDLFAVAVPQVGVLDMLRFHRWTIGYAWCSDYGNADAKKEDFEALYRYSPFHTVQNVAADREYPATLVMTADHDDRVVPAHSFKFTAALQDALGERPSQRQPLLIRIETKAGHGAGKPLTKVIEEYADYYAFVAKHVGAQWHD